MEVKDTPGVLYEGFCIDLLDKISTMLNFNYTVVKSPNNAYGTCKDGFKNCNGMVRELVEKVYI